MELLAAGLIEQRMLIPRLETEKNEGRTSNEPVQRLTTGSLVDLGGSEGGKLPGPPGNKLVKKGAENPACG